MNQTIPEFQGTMKNGRAKEKGVAMAWRRLGIENPDRRAQGDGRNLSLA